MVSKPWVIPRSFSRGVKGSCRPPKLQRHTPGQKLVQGRGEIAGFDARQPLLEGVGAGGMDAGDPSIAGPACGRSRGAAKLAAVSVQPNGGRAKKHLSGDAGGVLVRRVGGLHKESCWERGPSNTSTTDPGSRRRNSPPRSSRTLSARMVSRRLNL